MWSICDFVFLSKSKLFMYESRISFKISQAFLLMENFKYKYFCALFYPCQVKKLFCPYINVENLYFFVANLVKFTVSQSR